MKQTFFKDKNTQMQPKFRETVSYVKNFKLRKFTKLFEIFKHWYQYFHHLFDFQKITAVKRLASTPSSQRDIGEPYDEQGLTKVSKLIHFFKHGR